VGHVVVVVRLHPVFVARPRQIRRSIAFITRVCLRRACANIGITNKGINPSNKALTTDMRICFDFLNVSFVMTYDTVFNENDHVKIGRIGQIQCLSTPSACKLIINTTLIEKLLLNVHCTCIRKYI
jgi:hypothetical protein